MSTMPPPPAQQGMSTFAKWLIGCTVGCFLLIVGSCGGLFLIGHWISKAVVEQAEKMGAAQEAAKARATQVEQLDQTHPPRLPEDVAFAQLTDDDVARYLRIRRELQPAMQALHDTVRAIPLANPASLSARPSVKEMFGAVKGTVAGISEAQAAHLAILDAAEAALIREGLGPTDLSRMVEIVEWRFLQREEAAMMGLPAFRRREMFALQVKEHVLSELLARPLDSVGMEPSDRDRGARDLEDARARLAEVLAEARRNVSLLEPTRLVLEARRAELEALPVASVAAIAPLSGEAPWLQGLQGLEAPGGFPGGPPVGADGNWRWSSDGTPAPSEPAKEAPQEPTGAPDP